jgi:hypothetical protein
MILAIDPGPEQSAYVLYDMDKRELVDFGKVNNEEMVEAMGSWHSFGLSHVDALVIEMIASYGMPVGAEVFETCVFIGRLIQQWGDRDNVHRLYRSIVKHTLCGSMRAKDGNVRQALIDAWGGKEKAIGKKSKPGPLYGVSGDVWAALAVAVVYADRQEQMRGAA